MSMIKHLFAFALFFLAGTFAFGQNDSLPEDPSVYKDLPTYPYYPVNEKGGDLPDKVDFRAYCPKPSDQVTSCRCVGDALAHALAISLSRYCTKHTPQEHACSASFIFNQIKLENRCDKGAYLSDGLKLLKAKGGCSLTEFPNTTSCKRLPNATTFKKALPYRIASFEALFPIGAPDSQKLDQIRVSLANGHPVIVAMFIPADLRNREVPLGNKDYTSLIPKRGHALVVVGYDEDARIFTLMNSYGEKWGNNGFFTMPYDLMVAQVGYAYQLELPKGFRCPM